MSCSKKTGCHGTTGLEKGLQHCLKPVLFDIEQKDLER